MKKLINKRVLFAIAAVVLIWGVTAGVAYGAAVFQKSLSASVRVVGGDANFEFYSNQAATQVITSINLPDVTPGGTSTFTVYLKNTGAVSETVSAGTNTVSASVGTLTLTFDGQTQTTLAPGAVCRVVGTLRVSNSATSGSLNFSLSVNATAASSPPPTGTALSGQQLFTTYCLSCHASGPPNTSRSGTQLVNYIAGHQTGSDLTAQEVAAIAAFVKP